MNVYDATLNFLEQHKTTLRKVQWKVQESGSIRTKHAVGRGNTTLHFCSPLGFIEYTQQNLMWPRRRKEGDATVLAMVKRFNVENTPEAYAICLLYRAEENFSPVLRGELLRTCGLGENYDKWQYYRWT